MSAAIENLDTFVSELLHLNDIRGNRLLHVGDISQSQSGESQKAYLLKAPNGNDCDTMLRVIKSRRGKPSNKTVLADSALVRTTVDNPMLEKWIWCDLDGERDVKALDKFISDVYGVINLKGNNPLFLGIGNLRWSVSAGDEIREVNSPLLVFPIRFVRGTNTGPVEIEFVDDDAYFNPCLINKMRAEYSDEICAGFPHPNGKDCFDEAIDLEKTDARYIAMVESYVSSLCPHGDNNIAFDKNVIVIAQYNHADMCMYYDVRRNKQKIYEHPLVGKIFGFNNGAKDRSAHSDICPVLPIDSVQEKIISEIAGGKSLIIKGPPGTGKTLTIANTVATLLASGKRVLVSSEKLSALSEVYAKLPERLRKFVMLLDYETEKAAAAVNPSEVRADLKRLLKERKEYVYDSAQDIKYSRADRERADAMMGISRYVEGMFGGDVAFGSYYDAIDTYFKNADLPTIDFSGDCDISKIDKERYNALRSAVDSLSAYCKVMSVNGDITLCPWFNVHDGVDTEKAKADFMQIAHFMSAIEKIANSIEFKGVNKKDITYGNLYDAAMSDMPSANEIKKLCAAFQKPCDALERLIDNFISAQETPHIDNVIDGEKAEEYLCDIDDLSGLENIEYGVLDIATEYADLFATECATDEFIEKFVQSVEKIRELKKESNTLLPEAMFVFDKCDDITKLVKYADCISKYADGKAINPSLFDFKAKSALKALRGYCSKSDYGVAELAKAVAVCKRIAQCDGDVKTLTEVSAHIIGKDKLSESELSCVLAVAENSASVGMNTQAFVIAAKKAKRIAQDCVRGEVACDIALRKIFNGIRLACAKRMLERKTDDICKTVGIEKTDDAYFRAQAIAAILRVYSAPAIGFDIEKTTGFICDVRRIARDVCDTILKTVKNLKQFGETHFKNVYTDYPWRITIGGARAFADGVTDRAVLNAALSYSVSVRGDSMLSRFFAPIEQRDIVISPDKFTAMFDRSFYALAIENKLADLEKERNGLCKNAELNLERFRKAESELCECNAIKIEHLCMARIDPDDDDFDFLSIDKGIPSSLRKLFVANAEAILKLKRCFILTPSTASVLFRNKAYDNFDVVIVDEASQMEPVDILPVLVRSKQCVLVGDEFQMPPIAHFKAKNNRRISDPESELIADTDISALSLALGNLAFDTEELVCHYRSKVETLIEFSQRRFYPYMRTFPAVDPSCDGGGFTDIYTKDGFCEDGVNTIEGDAVIDALCDHFDKYYDNKSGVLSRSVGVVTFGEAQQKYVSGLVRKNAELYTKIETAKRNFDDVSDKLIFFRTIESVQGQEIDSLILSLTYGKDKTGKVKLAFGELNRDAIGNNIFNVAVTRAKSHITVIHSVTAADLFGNPRIAFIKDYLECCERFSKTGRNQFVSAPSQKGENFVKAIADFAESCGIDHARIVINYGVTEGSIKIPIAILSRDFSRAELGIWCEVPVLKKYDYVDYNVRYVQSLQSRGWIMHKIYAHDFYDNHDAECKALAAALDKYVTK